MGVRRGWALLLLAASITACAGDDRTGVSTGPPPWERQELDSELGADLVIVTGSDGESVVALVQDEDGVLHGASMGAEGRFTEGPPLDLGASSPGVGAITRSPDGWLAVGTGRKATDGLDFDPWVLSSEDGRTWREVATSGLEGPAELGGVAHSNGGFVAVGTLRTAPDPGDGGFLPAVWTSPDGRAWESVDLDLGGATEGTMGSVAAVDDALYASGRLGERGVLWRSTDGGASWSLVDADAFESASSVGAVVVNGEVLAASIHRETPELGEHGEYGEVALARSTDGGATWSLAEVPVRSFGYAEPMYAGGGWFFTAQPGGGRSVQYEPEVCYADITYCQDPPREQGSIFASRDGTSWERVDTRGLGELSHVGAISGTSSGGVVVLIPAAGRTEAWVWPEGAPLEMRDADPLPKPPEGAGVDLVDFDDELETGHRYAMPIGGHCGYAWIGADDRLWQLEGEEVYLGEAPEEWPVVGEGLIYGFVTLVDDDTIEYSIGDGEVIATFRPATEDPPGCA